jgi:PAS domain S-box-containing protein
LAEALPHLVWFARSDGAVTFYNRRIELYGGIAPGPDGIYQWAPIVHPDDLERTHHAWDQAVRLQQQYECEHRVRMADGSFRWHLSRALPLRTSTEVTWFGTATDTHVLAETREALTESESRLRSVFSAIDQGYCMCELVLDDDGVAIDYRFLETNPQFEDATGLRDAVGRTAMELVPSLESSWVQTYAEVALGNAPRRFQQASAAMGRHFDVFATPVAPRGRFALVFADITERKEAEQTLQQQRDREHDIAVSLQRSMLPTALVEHDRIEIAAVYVASEELQQVGGDWYETFQLRDGRIGVVVGDVVGHNIEAAAAMGQLRAAILALALHVDRPDQLLDETDAFARRYRITDFATAICIAVDPDEGLIEYSTAGHPPAMICPAHGEPRWLDDARSLPLGVREPNGRPSAEDSLDAGSILVVYSDGLIERPGEVIDVGMERLASAVRRHRAVDLESLCAAVLRDLAGEHGFDDDTVLVALRRSAG